MKQGYEDIMDLPHHRSSRHAPLSMESRAAQFAPFAALTGYEDALVEAELQMLEDRKQGKPMVTIRYFVPDERKEGGSYQVISGQYRKMDLGKEQVILEEGERIPLERIVDISSEIFEGLIQ